MTITLDRQSNGTQHTLAVDVGRTSGGISNTNNSTGDATKSPAQSPTSSPRQGILARVALQLRQAVPATFNEGTAFELGRVNAPTVSPRRADRDAGRPNLDFGRLADRVLAQRQLNPLAVKEQKASDAVQGGEQLFAGPLTQKAESVDALIVAIDKHVSRDVEQYKKRGTHAATEGALGGAAINTTSPSFDARVPQLVSNILVTSDDHFTRPNKAKVLTYVCDVLVSVYGHGVKEHRLAIDIEGATFQFSIKQLLKLARQLEQAPTLGLGALAKAVVNPSLLKKIARTFKLSPQGTAPVHYPIDLRHKYIGLVPRHVKALGVRNYSEHERALAARLINEHLPQVPPFPIKENWMSAGIFEAVAHRLIKTNNKRSAADKLRQVRKLFPHGLHWFKHPRAVHLLLNAPTETGQQEGLLHALSDPNVRAQEERYINTPLQQQGVSEGERLLDNIATSTVQADRSPLTVDQSDVNQLWELLEQQNQHFALFWEPLNPASPASVHSAFHDVIAPEATAIEDPNRVRKFLHANRITYSNGLNVIAAQKPIKTAIPGFMHMLVEQRVPLIVDLTTPNERENSDEHYGPTEIGKPLQLEVGGMAMGEVTLLDRSEVPGLGHLETLDIKKPNNFGYTETHRIQRLHFTSWPDQGVISPEQLQALGQQVRTLMGNNPDVLIHCRAGVGRTGTLATYLAAQRDLDQAPAASGEFSTRMGLARVTDNVLHGRLCRGNLFVQTPEQLKLVCDATVQQFNDRTNLLATQNTPTQRIEHPARATALTPQDSDARSDRPPVEQPPSVGPAPNLARRLNDTDLSKRLRLVQREREQLLTTMKNADGGPLMAVRNTDDKESPKRNNVIPLRQNHVDKQVRISSFKRDASIMINPAVIREALLKPDEAAKPQDNSFNHRLNQRTHRNVITTPAPAVWQAPAKVQRLWRMYEDAAAQMPKRFEPAVPVNDSGVLCPQHNIVQVEIGQHKRAPIHANRIDIAHHIKASSYRTYIAGQSPQQVDAAHHFLIHGITSGQGLLQFVAPQTHRDPKLTGEQTLVAYLERLISAADHQKTRAVLADRYEVQSLTQLPTQGLESDTKRYILAYKDLREPDAPQKMVPITQLGMNMVDGVLSLAAIKHAKQVFDEHRNVLNYLSGGESTGPTVVSFGGIGRPSVLITYDDVSREIQNGAIKDEAQLDAALERVVSAGRQARGAQFIHSSKQLSIVRAALLELLLKTVPTPRAFSSQFRYSI